jgi:glycosyltransferase involved in cell wall biosynthesis
VTARLWVDVEDLFEYAHGNPRPSGIQRLAFEIYRTMHARYNCTGLVRFVRHDPLRNSFRVVPWPDVAALFERLTDPEMAPSTGPEGGISPHPLVRRLIRRWIYHFPPPLRLAMIDVLLAEVEALRAWGQIAGTLWKGGWRKIRRLVVQPLHSGREPNTRHPITPVAVDVSFSDYAVAGDVLLVLGSPWSHPDYSMLIQRQRQRGLRFALLVYDLIPIRRPEWCDRGLVRLFRGWFQEVLPLCDAVFAISHATAGDVDIYARESGIALPGPVMTIPIGTGFGAKPQPPAESRSRALPSPATYVLIVSTIEARKNHTLAFRVWRRLLEDLPADRVPTLVFAGRIGWLVDDLMRQIANTDYLDGKLMVIENPTDAELATLYRGCLFTLFPSFYEGWGLPVTESLAFGKPCIISNRTSLPEAGGGLARSFDPDNLLDAYAVIRAVIEDRDELMRWEAEVQRDFKPVPWSATVQAILTGLGHPLEGFFGRSDPDPIGTSARDALGGQRVKSD